MAVLNTKPVTGTKAHAHADSLSSLSRPVTPDKRSATAPAIAHKDEIKQVRALVALCTARCSTPKVVSDLLSQMLEKQMTVTKEVIAEAVRTALKEKDMFESV